MIMSAACLISLLAAGLTVMDPPAATPSSVDPPAGPGSLAPNLALIEGTPEHSIVLTWLEPVEDAVEGASKRAAGRSRGFRLRMSQFSPSDRTWSAPTTIVERDDFFANWADVPSLIGAPGDESGADLYAHWPQKSGPDTYAYDVVMARSADGGEHWKTIGPVHNDGTQTEHGFVSLTPEQQGVRAFWLDGREMASTEDEAHGGHGQDHDSGGPGAMTLRTAAISASGEVTDRTLLDDRVCECCGTAAAVTKNGPVIVYRDRSENETRDIAIVRRAGGAWTTPAIVHHDNWIIEGCPVNGPAIAAHGNTVAVAWYTGATEEGAVRIAFSQDGGATFSPAHTIDDTFPAGRVAVMLDERGDRPGAIVCWLDMDAASPLGGAVRLRRIAQNGDMGPSVKVADASVARSAGFPRLERLSDDAVLIVWTEVGDATHLRARVVAIASIGAIGLR